MNCLSHRSRSLAISVSCFALVLTCVTTLFAGVQITRIADTTTTAPNGGQFASFQFEVAIEGEVVAFPGAVPLHGFGVYAHTDATGIYTIADDTLLPPNSDVVGPVSLDGTDVAFEVHGLPNGDGIMSTVGGLHIAYDGSTPTPGGAGTLERFGIPSLDNGHLVFHARASEGSVDSGIYTDLGGTLRAVADESTDVPGYPTRKMFLFSDPVIQSDVIAFIAHWTDSEIEEGIFVEDGGTLLKVLDSYDTEPIPGGEELNNFTNVAVDGRTLAIGTQTEANNYGIYTYDLDSSVLDLVADGTTPRPEGGGNFGILSPLAIDDGNLAFLSYEFDGTDLFYHGLYVTYQDVLIRITGTGDTLDGRTVRGLQMTNEAISGDRVAFTANFFDGSRGVYVAQFPEPTSATLLLIFAALTLLARRAARI